MRRSLRPVVFCVLLMVALAVVLAAPVNQALAVQHACAVQRVVGYHPILEALCQLELQQTLGLLPDDNYLWGGGD